MIAYLLATKQSLEQSENDAFGESSCMLSQVQRFPEWTSPAGAEPDEEGRR